MKKNPVDGWVIGLLAANVVNDPDAAVVAPITALLIVPPEITGELSDGTVARTGEPEPVTAFAKPVATPVPRPVMPVDNGRPVALVSVKDVGVPKAGAVSVGEVARTSAPEPVEDVAPVPPLATVNGVCSVMLLKVGDGYVCGNAIDGNSNIRSHSFFMICTPLHCCSTKRRMWLVWS